MKFSVLLLYPDYLATQYGEETYFTHVGAATVAEATQAARAEAVDGQQCSCDPADFVPLLVVKGWHKDLNCPA